MAFSAENIVIDKQQEIPMNTQDPDYEVSKVEEENDLIVLTNQISPDELINDEDILHTESLIEAGREESDDSYLQQHRFSFSIWDVMKKGAINLVLPFVNGMMLGFGEILAHEIGFKYNWVGAKVTPERRYEKKTPSKFL